MARTLIGQLILRLRAEGLGEAKKVVNTMGDIERAARRLGANGVGSWGIGFQKNLDKLKLAQSEIRQIEQSWRNLHASIQQRNLGRAMRSAEISHWKTNTISALAQGRAEIEKHFKAVEGKARVHASRMSTILKPALVMGGAYTGAYFTGILGMEALTASSERRREIFRQQMAGISPDDQTTLLDRSEGLSAQFPSMPVTGIMQLSRYAYSFMGSAERAMAVVEDMIRAHVVLQSTKGTDTADRVLAGLLRGLDNLGVNEDGQKGVDLVKEIIASVVKSAQVDPDINPEEFFPFAKRTKVAGPGLSPGFLSRAPVFMQDMGSEAAGNMIAMGFKAFALEAVGSAGGKKYLAERDRLGLRKDGELIDLPLYISDPDQWVLKNLIPALERDGVDINDDGAITKAVGKLSGNTNATGFLTRIITQREQIERWLELMEKASGIEIAEDVRFEDPFVGWEAFKKSLENLSAALTPIDTINAGLNGLADGINKLAKAGERNPALVGLGMAAGGYAAYKGGQGLLGKLSDAFGLKSSAVALDGSAAALTRAAVALGGSGVAGGDLPDGRKGGKGGKGGALGLLGWAGTLGLGIGSALAVQSLGDSQGDDFEDQVARQQKYKETLQRHIRTIGGLFPDAPDISDPEAREQQFREAQQRQGQAFAPPATPTVVEERYGAEINAALTDLKSQQEEVSAWRRFMLGKAADPDFDFREHMRIGPERSPPVPAAAASPAAPTESVHRAVVDEPSFTAAEQRAQQAGETMKQSLSIEARPDVDTSALDEAIQKGLRLNAVLNQLGAAITSTTNSVGAEMRRNFADTGG
ncbi:MAG TPA: hypothetical protein VNS02_04970 [Rhizobiaceae bacterium]|nr:hypothetical protein [Rhizobiaceae bacterium]